MTNSDSLPHPTLSTSPAGEFGRLMREARLRQGIGVRELARRLRVSDAYISRLERHQCSAPAPQRAVEIALALDLDVDLFLAATGHVAPDVKAILVAQPEFAQFVRDLAASRYSKNQLQYLLRSRRTVDETP